jgi:hypothetical protein
MPTMLTCTCTCTCTRTCTPTGEFPDLPPPEAGGSKAILNPPLPTVQQLLDASAAAAAAGGAGGSKGQGKAGAAAAAGRAGGGASRPVSAAAGAAAGGKAGGGKGGWCDARVCACDGSRPQDGLLHAQQSGCAPRCGMRSHTVLRAAYAQAMLLLLLLLLGMLLALLMAGRWLAPPLSRFWRGLWPILSPSGRTGPRQRAPQRRCAVLCLLCCAALCCAALCCAVLCCAVLCCVLLCCAVLCSAVLCHAAVCTAAQVGGAADIPSSHTHTCRHARAGAPQRRHTTHTHTPHRQIAHDPELLKDELRPLVFEEVRQQVRVCVRARVCGVRAWCVRRIRHAITSGAVRRAAPCQPSRNGGAGACRLPPVVCMCVRDAVCAHDRRWMRRCAACWPTSRRWWLRRQQQSWVRGADVVCVALRCVRV